MEPVKKKMPDELVASITTGSVFILILVAGFLSVVSSNLSPSAPSEISARLPWRFEFCLDGSASPRF